MSTLVGWLVVIFGIFLAYIFNSHLIFPVELPDLDTESFSLDPRRSVDTDVTPKAFQISLSESTLELLHAELNRTKFFDSFPQSKFTYGANSDYLRSLRDHWLNVYNWRKWETILNRFSNFKVRCQGLDVHFVHSKPPSTSKYTSIKPLLMVHGWPGSTFELYKILPILSDPASFNVDSRGVALQVVAPSIPGFGWSDKPEKSGFSPLAAAKMFGDLMINKLGFSNFYCQGGDWGSIICTYVAQLYPENVLGIHITMAHAPLIYPGMWAQLFIGYFAPGLAFDSASDYHKIFPIGARFLDLLQESGYFHIQATKPDTIGFALLNSPMALAAYLVEKFSTWTNLDYRNLNDGGLGRHFSIDELLTNVMIYYSTDTILTSQRLYKEHFQHPYTDLFNRASVSVPTGVASFAYEPLRCQPKTLLSYKYRNVTHYEEIPRGGHFGAFEEPHLLAEQIFKFLKTL